MTHNLDIVTCRIMQIGAVVVGMIVRSHTRSPIILPSAEESRLVECVYLRTIYCSI